MSNSVKGEVEFDAFQTTYKLRYSTNALCELEEKTGKAVVELTSTLARLSSLRGLLWAGLIEFHPQITMKQVGELIDELKPPRAMELVSTALQLAFPKPQGGDEDPQ